MPQDIGADRLDIFGGDETAAAQKGVGPGRLQKKNGGTRRRAILNQRSQIESELPKPLVATVKRLEAGRQGMFLSKADDGICQSCFVRVRPQGFQEVKLALKIHACSNCKRLLYHEPSLARMAAPDQGTIEAVNGGAV